MKIADSKKKVVRCLIEEMLIGLKGFTDPEGKRIILLFDIDNLSELDRLISKSIIGFNE